MSQNVYLIAYDVSDDRRRTDVYRTLRGYGERVQYSVFRCVLSPVARTRLTARLRFHVNTAIDRVLFADLGPYLGRGDRAITTLGTPLPPSDHGPVIV